MEACQWHIGCVEDERQYIKAVSSPEMADEFTLSLGIVDDGFTKLNSDNTSVYRGKRRSV